MIQRVLHEMGAPVALVQWTAEENTRETTTALMSHRQVGMVLATGGRAMVDAAYRSGKPAIGVGPGNEPALVAADADLPHVARSVVQSKSFDNGLVCGAENHLVVDASVRPALISALESRGAAVLTESEAARFLVAAVDRETREVPRWLAHIERPYRSSWSFPPNSADRPPGWRWSSARSRWRHGWGWTSAALLEWMGPVTPPSSTRRTAIVRCFATPSAPAHPRGAGDAGPVRAHDRFAASFTLGRHLGWKLHDRQRHLPGPAEHQARGVPHVQDRMTP